MKFYPEPKPPCACPADKTWTTAVLKSKRGRPPVWKRAKQIHHILNGIRSWHWSDITNRLTYP